MNKLTKIIIVAFIVLTNQTMNAQTFGIKGGFNLATLVELDQQYIYSINYSNNPGFHVGVSLDLPFSKFFSFEPALLFTTNGTKYEVSESGVTYSGKANLYYIDVPLNLKLGIKLDRRGKNKLFFSAGPYIGYGIMGKKEATFETAGQSESTSEDINWGSDADEDNFKHLDYGMCMGAGFEIGALSLGASYNFGIANISAYQENGLIAQNRVIQISVGYLFKGNSRGGYSRGKQHRRRR